MLLDLYTSGDYLKKNPCWHVNESPWKAREILKMLACNQLLPKTICEVGCGAGEVLRLLQQRMDVECTFWGYDISPQAIEMSRERTNERLHFKLADFTKETDVYYDLILVMDVIEHLEDYFTFLRAIQMKSTYKIVQLPLDLSVRSLLQGYLGGYREKFGHLHYFTKELALQMFEELGYEVLDCRYTAEPMETPKERGSSNSLQGLKKYLGRQKRALPRFAGNFAFTINEDMAARLFGHWRLLILLK